MRRRKSVEKHESEYIHMRKKTLGGLFLFSLIMAIMVSYVIIQSNILLRKDPTYTVEVSELHKSPYCSGFSDEYLSGPTGCVSGDLYHQADDGIRYHWWWLLAPIYDIIFGLIVLIVLIVLSKFFCDMVFG